MIKAGDLRSRIVIQRMAAGQDAAGEENGAWQTVATVWGELTNPRSKDLGVGKEQFASEQVIATVDSKIIIRHPLGVFTVSPKDRATITAGRNAGRVFDIQVAIDPDSLGNEIHMFCVERRV
jgi:SPP1 family predicted phage head-tail adaptor